jgi:hypothetical protein
MRRVNFFYPEIFERKFNRKPKSWTVEQLHDLYLRAKERAEKRWNISKEIMEEIQKEVFCHDNRTKVYFYQTVRDETYLRSYEFNWSGLYNKHTSYSIGDPKLNNREERLDFLISNTKAFELGQKFRDSKVLEDMAWTSSWKIRDIFWQVLERKLRNIYEDKVVKDTILVEISGYKYFIHVENGYYGYPSFSLKNEFDGEIIKVGGTIDRW